MSPPRRAYSASGLLSDKASEVLAALAPTGDVESLMLSVASLATPMSSWQGAAVVADATTQPFRKVPDSRVLMHRLLQPLRVQKHGSRPATLA